MTSPEGWLRRGLLLVGMVAGVAGCGWTPRDEFLKSREVVIKPHPGNGSRDSGAVAQRPPPAQLSAHADND